MITRTTWRKKACIPFCEKFPVRPAAHANTVLYPSNIDFEKIKNGEFKPVGGHYGIVRCLRLRLDAIQSGVHAGPVKPIYEQADTTNTQAGEEDNVPY